MVNCLYLCDAPARCACLAPFHVPNACVFWKWFDCASCARQGGRMQRVRLLRLSAGDWDATFIKCRSAGVPMSLHANTMEREIPAQLVVFEWSSPWRSAASDHRWSLLCPPANPPGRIRSAVASQRSYERQTFLFHSCSRGGCKKVRTCGREKAPRR
jgi:hypothetical protein